MKEVYEETGIEVEPVALISVLDGLRLGFARTPLYSMLFHCRMIGGELRGHPLETRAWGSSRGKRCRSRWRERSAGSSPRSPPSPATSVPATSTRPAHPPGDRELLARCGPGIPGPRTLAGGEQLGRPSGPSSPR